jgi:hypothetical protein
MIIYAYSGIGGGFKGYKVIVSMRVCWYNG